MIKIICVGKVKEDYFNKCINEYLKRISKYTKLEIIELIDYSYDEAKTVYEEGRNILSKISEKDYVICMDINGKELDSIEFSEFIRSKITLNITFIIGGSYGISNEVKKRANEIMSFSKLTFPHKLFRIILLEQIYRAFKILNNESYHK